MKRSHVLFDAVVLVAYLLAANPLFTGIPLHEFAGLGAVVFVAVHVVLSADGLLVRGRKGSAVRAMLNGVLLLALAACAVSGVMVSGEVLPALGLYATGYFFWDPLHALSAKVLLVALIVHMVVRAPVALAVLRRRTFASTGCEDCEEREPLEA